MNRRDFVYRLLATLPLMTVASRTLAQEGKPAAAPKPDTKSTTTSKADAKPAAGKADDLKMVKESDPMAKSLNYCDDADKKKEKVCPMRKEEARAKQYCDNCQFYTAAGKDKGKCQILQNQGVKAKGWCNSWVQKAGA